MDELDIKKISAVKMFEQRSIGRYELDVFHEFLSHYGHSTVIECLEKMAGEAIEQDEANQLSYADQAAYLARNLKSKGYRDAFDLAASLSNEIVLIHQEINDISTELRDFHANFSLFWYKIKQIVKPRNILSGYGCEIVSALRVDWGSRDTLDVEHLQAIISEFLEEVLRKAAMDPKEYSFYCVWRLTPGKYLEFSKLADRVPELIDENKKISELFRRKHELMKKLNSSNSHRMCISKNVSDYIANWRKTIDAVGIDKIAIQLDK